MGKSYRALVGRSDLPDRFTITEPIGKVPHPILGYVYAATPNGQFAHSDCQVLKRQVDTTLLAIKILTGRPHQIRIHLAAAGYPLVGDPLYDIGGRPKLWVEASFEQLAQQSPGKLPVPGDCGYHLHACALSFTHPRTGQAVRFTCPAPVNLT
jgi:23S rRNA pseudouridine1911/1915/1917 synthase